MRLLDCKLHAAAQSEPLRACTGKVLTKVGDITVHSPKDMHAAIQATGQRHADNSITIDLHFAFVDVVDEQQRKRKSPGVSAPSQAAEVPDEPRSSAVTEREVVLIRPASETWVRWGFLFDQDTMGLCGWAMGSTARAAEYLVIDSPRSSENCRRRFAPPNQQLSWKGNPYGVLFISVQGTGVREDSGGWDGRWPAVRIVR